MKFIENHMEYYSSITEWPSNSNVEKWFSRLVQTNREILKESLSLNYHIGIELIRKIPRLRTFFSPSSYKDFDSVFWFGAFNVLGLALNHALFGNKVDLEIIKEYFDRQLDNNQNWTSPLTRVDHFMKGYSLIYLDNILGNHQYEFAIRNLYNHLAREIPRLENGIYCYFKDNAILVDTLGMICPFLARYGKYYSDTEAKGQSVNQLLDYVRNNVDNETHLPFHAYYPEGPRKLGSLGWGRGTAWYLLGIVDTLAELETRDEGYEELCSAFTSTVKTLETYQKSDGNWSWSILLKNDHIDSSTTSMLGYCLARGIQIGVIDNSFIPILNKAITALEKSTLKRNGWINHGLMDCAGIGKYPQAYGPQPWLQGISLSFAAAYLKLLGQHDQSEKIMNQSS